eukprot:scaffold10054_cov140-Cylindrotheca_fusiformis.AAC.10
MKEMGRHRVNSFKMDTKGVCCILHPERKETEQEEKRKRRILPSTCDDGGEDQGQHHGCNNQEAGCTSRSQRKRIKTQLFEPCLSGGSNQMNNSTKNTADGHKKKMKLRKARRTRAKHVIRDPVRRYSVVTAMAGKPGTLGRGGASRAAKFKQRKTVEHTVIGALDLVCPRKKKSESTPEQKRKTSTLMRIEALKRVLSLEEQELQMIEDKENERPKAVSMDGSKKAVLGGTNVTLNPLLPRTPPREPQSFLSSHEKAQQKEVTRNGTVIASRKQNQQSGEKERFLPHLKKKLNFKKFLPSSSRKKKIDKRNKMKVEKARKDLGVLLSYIKDLESHPARRPYLASLAAHGHAKEHVEAALGLPIHSNEWTKIQIHAKWPGPLKPVYRKKISRMRVPKDTMIALLSFLESPGTSQKYAFGTQLLSICGGRDTIEIDNVSLRKKLDHAVSEYLLEVYKEIEPALDSVQDLPEDDDRCSSKEKNEHHPRRCLKEKDHDGKCAFTPRGSISRTTALNLAKMLTGPEIKKLAGLDDVKVLKGRDNFEKARKIADELFLEHEVAHAVLKQRIDNQELFLQTDYIPHLRTISDNKCNCLTCGFSDKDCPEDIVCPRKDTHGPSCTRCAEGFAIFHEMKAKIQEKENEARVSPVATNLQLQKLDQLRCDVETCISNLRDFRGHLARQTSEAEQAMLESENLQDDTAIVTSDYKMKILACFFRENQKKWFGKRGTTALGFMIVTNPTDPNLKADGIKDVTFVMMVTDDSRQDDWAVACGKSYIYQNHLPHAIKKVIFVADGAGCFKSKLHRAIQGFWANWTGVTEVKYRNTPAGDGKTCLDGMFGRYNTILSTAVDNGASYWNAETILKALDVSNGLASTKFVGYSPLRLENPLLVEVARNEKYSSSILTTILASDCSQSTHSLSYAFKHTGFGTGKELSCSGYFKFFTKEKTGDGMKEKKTGICFYDKETGHLDDDMLESYMPYWKDLCAATNAKQDTQSRISKPGEGPNSEEVRGKNRKNRMRRVSAKIRKDEEDIRREQKECGLFLCDKKCEETRSYCEKVCLTNKGLGQHQSIGKHKFPSQNAKDWIARKCGKVGGAYAIGSRPNRRSHSLFEDIMPADPGTPAEIAARCFQHFTRSDTIQPQLKTDGQVCFLLECFGRPDKLNPMQTVALMRNQIDEIDGGLKFCNKKAHIQTNGSVLTEEQVGSWQSQEVSKRDSNKDVSGVSRLKALKSNLGLLKRFILSDRKGTITSMNSDDVNAVLFSLGISGTGKKLHQKQKMIEELNLDGSSFDEMVRDVSSRIKMYEFSIAASKGRFKQDAEARNQRLEEELNLVMNLESAQHVRN